MGRIIGDGGCFYTVVDIAVAPPFQGRGLGKRIMKALDEWLRENAEPSAYVTLVADGEARHLYAKYGFVETARHRSTWNTSSPRTRLTSASARSRARELPRQHASVAIRHHAVERARIVVEHQRQELAVAFPHRQVVQALARHPLQRAFGIAFERGAGEAADEEDEAEPVLALLAETGQLIVPRSDRSTQSMPASSWISLRMPASTSSSGSILPPRPLYLPSWWSSGRALRWTISTSRPSADST
jgi:hypothetical protein